MKKETERAIIAKTSEKSSKYLPLWLHHRDTEQVMNRLFDLWLSDAARESIGSDMAEEMLRKTARFLALTHDLGKATPCFQQKVYMLVQGGAERLNESGLIWKRLPNAVESPHPLAGEILLLEAGCDESVASVVGAHHGKPTSENKHDDPGQMDMYPENYHGTAATAWQKVQREIICAALTATGFTDVSEIPHLSVPSQMLLSGLLIMADWIASNPELFSMIDVDEPYFRTPEERGEAAWLRLSLPECWQPERLWSTESLCQSRFFDEYGVGYSPNSVQQTMIQVAESVVQPGIMILEAQMGVGKTEAALLAAEVLSNGMSGNARRGGIYFGLPTQATANGIFPRIRQWAEHMPNAAPASIRLAHGSASLNEDFMAIRSRSKVEEDSQDESGLMVHEWFMGRKQVLLSDFVIGTIDQLLMASLRQKHVMLRHLGLCGKVVIIDEVHAYDAYMSQYLEMTLTWLGKYRVPVILLSATLPPQRREKLVEAYLDAKPADDGAQWKDSLAYPQLTWSEGRTVRQLAIPEQSITWKVMIERAAFEPDDMAGLAACISDRLSSGGCAGVIVNTVRRAQQVAAALMDRVEDIEVLLLHAQYVMPDRIDHENKLLRRIGKRSGRNERDRLVIVGTQVVEQSLDIDVDFLVTDLCPMDLLLQRIGRLHRHRVHDMIRPERLQKACCMVMGAGDKPELGSRHVYGDYLLMRTSGFLPDLISLPDDIPVLVRNTYDERVALPMEPAGYLNAKEEYHLKQLEQMNRAEAFRLNKPAEFPDLPWLETMTGMLDCSYHSDDLHAQAMVRDGDPSVDILLLKRYNGNEVGFVDNKNGPSFSLEYVPDEKTCMDISRQKIRLPRSLCVPWQKADQVIGELERRNGVFAEWRQSEWLRGELILLLDEQNTTSLCGYSLYYDRETGLHCTKEETDESSRV